MDSKRTFGLQGTLLDFCIFVKHCTYANRCIFFELFSKKPLFWPPQEVLAELQQLDEEDRDEPKGWRIRLDFLCRIVGPLESHKWLKHVKVHGPRQVTLPWDPRDAPEGTLHTLARYDQIL